MEKPDKETKERWFNDPKNWRLWLFYYNPEDKRIFPPKRTRLGWTTNFANPYSVLALIILLLAVVAFGYFMAKYDS